MKTDILLVSHIDSRYNPLINKLFLELLNSYPSKSVRVIGFTEVLNDYDLVQNQKDGFIIHNLFFRGLPNFFGIIRRFLIIIEYLAKLIFTLKKNKPQLIYCFNHVSLVGVLPYLVLWSNTKFIYHARELESEQYGFSKLKRRLILSLEKIASSKFSYMVTPSNQITAWYRGKLSIDNAVTLINSPSNNRFIELENDYFAKKFGFDQNEVIFIHVGNLTHGRNIDGMIDFFESRKDSGVLIFLGKIVDKEYEYIASSSFTNVFYHTPVEYDLLHNYLSRASIGIAYIEDVSSSNRLTLGNKFLDYVCAGIPILCTSMPEMVYYVDFYNLGFVFENNQASFAEAISTASNALGCGLKIQVPLELTWGFQREKFIEIIKESLMKEDTL